MKRTTNSHSRTRELKKIKRDLILSRVIAGIAIAIAAVCLVLNILIHL